KRVTIGDNVKSTRRLQQQRQLDHLHKFAWQLVALEQREWFKIKTVYGKCARWLYLKERLSSRKVEIRQIWSSPRKPEAFVLIDKLLPAVIKKDSPSRLQSRPKAVA